MYEWFMNVDYLVNFIGDRVQKLKAFVFVWMQVANKGLESDPSNSPPAQEHFAIISNFYWIHPDFLF